jgi:hypothetical protein
MQSALHIISSCLVPHCCPLCLVSASQQKWCLIRFSSWPAFNPKVWPCQECFFIADQFLKLSRIWRSLSDPQSPLLGTTFRRLRDPALAKDDLENLEPQVCFRVKNVNESVFFYAPQCAFWFQLRSNQCSLALFWLPLLCPANIASEITTVKVIETINTYYLRGDVFDSYFQIPLRPWSCHKLLLNRTF